MEFYCEENLQKTARLKKAHTVIAVCVAAAALLSCVLLCVFTTHANKTATLVSACVIAVAGGWYVIAAVFLAILPNKYRLRHILTVSEYERTEISGEVEEINCLTVSKWLSAYEVTLSSEGRQLRVLWNTDMGEAPFAAGQKVKLFIADRFITEYGGVL